MYATALLLIAAGSLLTPSPATPDGSSVATFEGRPIELQDGWGDAHACYADTEATRCYRSEADMDATEGTAGAGWRRVEATCSSTLRLYTGLSFGGNVLALSQRAVVIGLGAYGFSNVTSSYKVGACSSTFYDGAVGSAVYPGNTSAGASATAMLSGWDNRISTVYIS